MKRRIIAYFLISVLLVSLVPTTSAYKGYQLSRGAISDFTLIDQDENNVTLSLSNGEILVVAFIFTRCPDVCPVITQSLKSVQDGLSSDYSDDVGFMSISVDPEYDTPERLKAFTELHDVNWPHLTGDLEAMEELWNNFGLVVQKNVIEAHVADENGHQSNDSTVIFVDGEGNSSELMSLPTAWSLTNTIVDENNLSINYSTHPQYGHMISGINGTESPSDWSWYWRFMVHNETSESWQESSVGVDFVDLDEYPNIAYLASNADETLLSKPANDTFSMSLVYPDNASENFIFDEDDLTAWHLTIGAFDGAGVNYSSSNHPQFGHFFSSFNDEDPASDNWSWYWELHTWNESDMSWEYSQLGVDSIEDPQYIAWARNTTEDSEIPLPGAVQSMIDQQNNQVCDGHGWEMGSGSGKHCMCDEGYEWPEDTMLSCVSVEVEEEYSVGHSTTTFILDGERKPRVAWTGDNWDPSEFISDIETLAALEGLIDDSSEGIPGLTFAIAFISMGAAAIAINVRSTSNEEEN
jgi:protein SCO1/2